MILSNWRFTRDIQGKSDSSSVCRPEDCTVGFKISSSQFKTKSAKAGESLDFNFDRQGAVFPYSAFRGLLNNDGMINIFLNELSLRFEQDEGPLFDTIPPAPTSSDLEDVSDEPDDDDEDEAIAEENNKTGTSETSSVVTAAAATAGVSKKSKMIASAEKQEKGKRGRKTVPQKNRKQKN